MPRLQERKLSKNKTFQRVLSLPFQMTDQKDLNERVDIFIGHDLNVIWNIPPAFPCRALQYLFHLSCIDCATLWCYTITVASRYLSGKRL
jgi:hypothetical protein